MDLLWAEIRSRRKNLGTTGTFPAGTPIVPLIKLGLVHVCCRMLLKSNSHHNLSNENIPWYIPIDLPWMICLVSFFFMANETIPR